MRASGHGDAGTRGHGEDNLTRRHGDTVTRGKGINVHRTGRFARVRHMEGRREEVTGGHAVGVIEDCRHVMINRFSKEHAYRLGRMGEMQGQSPEGTGAYTITYARIVEGR